MSRSRPQIALLAALCCAAALAFAAPGAGAACGKTQRFAATADAGPGSPPLIVGDSVLLGAAEEAAAIGYDVDVRICRSVDEGLDVMRKRLRAKRLPRLVVIALGSNSTFTRANVRAALRIAGPGRMRGLVTPREIRGMPLSDAAVLRAAARRWPKRIELVDWVAYARKRPKLTYSDGIHLTPAGQRAMARLLRPPLEHLTDSASEPPPTGGSEDGGGAAAP